MNCADRPISLLNSPNYANKSPAPDQKALSDTKPLSDLRLLTMWFSLSADNSHDAAVFINIDQGPAQNRLRRIDFARFPQPK